MEPAVKKPEEGIKQDSGSGEGRLWFLYVYCRTLSGGYSFRLSKLYPSERAAKEHCFEFIEECEKEKSEKDSQISVIEYPPKLLSRTVEGVMIIPFGL
jgi:hypothetical protein